MRGAAMMLQRVMRLRYSRVPQQCLYVFARSCAYHAAASAAFRYSAILMMPNARAAARVKIYTRCYMSRTLPANAIVYMPRHLMSREYALSPRVECYMSRADKARVHGAQRGARAAVLCALMALPQRRERAATICC